MAIIIRGLECFTLQNNIAKVTYCCSVIKRSHYKNMFPVIRRNFIWLQMYISAVLAIFHRYIYIAPGKQNYPKSISWLTIANAYCPIQTMYGTGELLSLLPTRATVRARNSESAFQTTYNYTAKTLLYNCDPTQYCSHLVTYIYQPICWCTLSSCFVFTLLYAQAV